MQFDLKDFGFIVEVTQVNLISAPLKVTIQSRNDKGTSTKAPTVARGYSGENTPSLAASELTVIQSTSNGAILQWTVISEDQEAQVNGFFRGYRIEWCDVTLTQIECEKQKRFQVCR